MALRGLVVLHWLALVSVGVLLGLAATAVGIKHQTDLRVLWCLLGLYGVANLILQAMLHFRSWYERTPRAAIHKLWHLLLMVLVWDLVNLILGVHALGGIAGPLAPAIPMVSLMLFILLAPRSAYLLSAAMIGLLVAAHYMVEIGQNLFPRIPLETLQPTWLPMYVFSIAALLLAAWLTGRHFRISIEHTQDMIDSRFGGHEHLLFQKHVLLARGEEELRRARVHNTSTSLIMIELRGLGRVFEQDACDGVLQQLDVLARSIVVHTRVALDTCSYIGRHRFCVLLPTAAEQDVAAILQRIRLAHADQSDIQLASKTQPPAGDHDFAAVFAETLSEFES